MVGCHPVFSPADSLCEIPPAACCGCIRDRIPFLEVFLDSVVPQENEAPISIAKLCASPRLAHGRVEITPGSSSACLLLMFWVSHGLSCRTSASWSFLGDFLFSSRDMDTMSSAAFDSCFSSQVKHEHELRSPDRD